MKLIDGKGKVFGIINIIDLIVVLLVIAVVARFAMSTTSSPLTVETKNIEVVLQVKDVRDATANVIKEGDIVRETKTNVILGKVTKVDVTPAQTLVETADGRVVDYPNPVLKDVSITVVGTGTAGENAIVLGNSEIRIGTSLTVKTNLYSVISTVVEINVL
ncbi:MAG: DUF4330 domain-containing protein [Thermoanaerobacterales bacterium]|jgi:hypothetical protein|nr:DUF4330 domain-containing protein [Thermoanaerobacterales bacterium]